MTFDDWWKTKDLEKANVPIILKNALRDLACEAWTTAQQEDTADSGLEMTFKRCPKCGETLLMGICEFGCGYVNL